MNRMCPVIGLTAAGCLIAACASAPSLPAMAKLTGPEIAVLTNATGTARATARVSNAFEALIQRCMRSKGLAYYPDLVTAADQAGPSLAGLPQASISLAARKTNGYGFYSTARLAAARSGSSHARTSREEAYADSLPGRAGEKYRLALDGPDYITASVTFPGGATATLPAGGCRGSAERRIYGSAAGYAQATTGLSLQTDQLYNAVTADPAFAGVAARWSWCMAQRGFRYPTPEDLWDSLAARVARNPAPAMRRIEMKVSVADYRCAAAVALIPTVRALQHKHATSLSRIFAANLAMITRIEARALKAAKALRLPR